MHSIVELLMDNDVHVKLLVPEQNCAMPFVIIINYQISRKEFS